MSNDIEIFINLIYLTDIMSNLRSNNFDEYLSCINLTQNWNEFKSIEEIINLGNNHINNAIKEILGKEDLLGKIKEDTNIDIEKLKQL